MLDVGEDVMRLRFQAHHVEVAARRCQQQVRRVRRYVAVEALLQMPGGVVGERVAKGRAARVTQRVDRTGAGVPDAERQPPELLFEVVGGRLHTDVEKLGRQTELAQRLKDLGRADVVGAPIPGLRLEEEGRGAAGGVL